MSGSRFEVLLEHRHFLKNEWGGIEHFTPSFIIVALGRHLLYICATVAPA